MDFYTCIQFPATATWKISKQLARNSCDFFFLFLFKKSILKQGIKKRGTKWSHTSMWQCIPLWWSLSWCFFSSLIGRWDCPPSALDSARRPALLPMGGMAGGCKPEGCGVSGTGRPCPCDKCWAWSCCCCEKRHTDIEFVQQARSHMIDPVHQMWLIR